MHPSRARHAHGTCARRYHAAATALEGRLALDVHGVQLARLAEARALLRRAHALCQRRAPPAMRPAVDAALALVEAAHASAARDNEFIYHERVPPIDALPPCRRAPSRMVKPTHPHELERATTMAHELGTTLGALQGWP